MSGPRWHPYSSYLLVVSSHELAKTMLGLDRTGCALATIELLADEAKRSRSRPQHGAVFAGNGYRIRKAA